MACCRCLDRQTLLPESTEGTMHLCSSSPIQLPLIAQENYMNSLEDFQLESHRYKIQGRQSGVKSCSLSLVLPALTPSTAKRFPPRGPAREEPRGTHVLEVTFQSHIHWCCPFQRAFSGSTESCRIDFSYICLLASHLIS